MNAPSEALHEQLDPDHLIKSGFLKLSSEKYHSGPGIGSHGLMEMLRSPAHYQHMRVTGVGRKPTPAMEFGTLFHFAVLEPEEFKRRARMEPECDKRTTKGKETYQQWLADCPPDALIVSPKNHDRLMGMLTKIEETTVAKNLIMGPGLREHSGYWIDKETGVLCRIRPDLLTSDGELIDVKSTTDARPGPFSHDIAANEYDLQMAFYREGVFNITGKHPTACTYFAVESDGSFGIGLHYASSEILARGERLFRKALSLYRDCLDKNVWPAYPDKITKIYLPDWARKQEEIEGAKDGFGIFR